MPRRQVVSMKDGVYTCPIKNCGKKYVIMRSLRYHCRDVHNILISTSTKNSARLYQRYKMEKQFERRGGRKELFDEKDFHLGLVKVKQSTIPNAGRGVFATRELKRGDIVTEFVGKFVLNEPIDTEYTIKVKGGFIDGERNPSSSSCLGSLINREYRILNLRKNVVFEEIDNNRVVVKAIKKIKTDKELITTYSRQYRNK